MRARLLMASVVAAAVVACGSAPPPAGPPHEEAHDAGASEAAPVATVQVEAPERSRPPSTASYEEALSTPEALDIHDDHAHLTDAQLTGPMRNVLSGCRVPSNVKITIKTAVQNGRAIGVSVDVRFDHGKSTRRPPAYLLRAEAKQSAKITTCVEKAVRNVTWPPSKRRDSFTTEF